MGLARIKTWVKEILTYADLNAEFANIYNNGEDLSTPATKAHDMNGFQLVLDADADSAIGADATDDRVDIVTQGVRTLMVNGSVASVVNGAELVASATGVDVALRAQGTDTNIDLDLQGKGTGRATLDGALPSLAAQVFSF